MSMSSRVANGNNGQHRPGKPKAWIINLLQVLSGEEQKNSCRQHTMSAALCAVSFCNLFYKAQCTLSFLLNYYVALVWESL